MLPSAAKADRRKQPIFASCYPDHCCPDKLDVRPQIVVWAREWCIARKKQGLLAAHQNMLREVMLLGLISFLLVAFEDKLESICGALRRFV